MIPIRIPAEDMKVLEEERYTHPHPRVQRKRHTLYLVGLGYPRHDVARIIGVSEGISFTPTRPVASRPSGGLTPIPKRRPWTAMPPPCGKHLPSPRPTPCKRPWTGSNP